jgi:hypothetical protein
VIQGPDRREYVILILTDISAQKRVEEQLRESNAHLEKRQNEMETELVLAARVQQSLAPRSLIWQDLVRFMFQRFAEVPSLSGLRGELHRRGWYTRSGKPWGKMALDHILRNPIYCGQIRFNEQRFKGEQEALIEEVLFTKVQSLRRDRSHGTTKLSRVFLLKGLIRCSECGAVPG